MKKFTVAALALTTLLSGSAFAHEAGEFFMRAGPATVRPTEGAGGTLGHLNGFDVSNNTQLGLTFTYMATDNIGVELLAATPFRHKVGTGATGDIATVHLLPPTLMAQWYFGDSSSKVRPYVGVGVNYTTFFDLSLIHIWILILPPIIKWAAFSSMTACVWTHGYLCSRQAIVSNRVML